MYALIKLIGVDLDVGPNQDAASFKKFVKRAEARAQEFGYVVESKATKKGHHLKVLLHRPLGFWRCVELRYYIGDDPRRLFYDVMRHRTGGKMIDTLFDKKEVAKK